ncbi:hypothetical protein CCACVL1_15486 [Corchorus capsularis]|uniref:Gnk2-homologous domain-containing protein n=1 Tax=Corchorus capsularis TaxID=210143 RepID=A0A1R3I285_COCAP|nr:hypothetical protein CCACVL1_15486 [Corchorus capsularis]
MVAVGTSILPLFLYSVLLFHLPLFLSLDVFLFENCTQGTNFTATSTYQANLNRIVSQLSSLTEFNNGFYNLSVGTSPDNVNAIALCTADRTREQCISCVNYTITELRGACPWNKEAIAWSEFCMVKYANRNLFGNLENDPRKCAPSPAFAMNPDQFNAAVSQLMNKLNFNATAGDPRKYASGQTKSGFDTVYGSVQCTPDLDDASCGSCLNFSTTELLNCCSGKIGCRVLSPNCMLRFESNPFENEAPEPPGPPPPPTHSPTGKASDKFFHNDSLNGIHSLFLCRNDVNTSTCQECVKNSTQTLTERCPTTTGGIIWYDECMLRYSNINFLGQMELNPAYLMWNLANLSNPEEASVNIQGLYSDLVEGAPAEPTKFLTKERPVFNGNESRYGLAQCSRDLNETSCYNCLNYLHTWIEVCCKDKKGWRVGTPSCNIRIEEYQFFNLSTPAAPPPEIQDERLSEEIWLRSSATHVTEAPDTAGIELLTSDCSTT